MQAIDALGGVLTRHPQNADAYAYRGYAYLQMGDLDRAGKNLRQALAIDPAHLGANKYMADVYLIQGNVERAEEQMLAIQSICGGTVCEELTELQSALNAYKRPAAKDSE